MAYPDAKKLEVEILSATADEFGRNYSVREISKITGVPASTVHTWLGELKDRGPLSPEAPVPPSKDLEADVANLALVKAIDLLYRISNSADKETQNVATAFAKLVEKYLQLTGQGPAETLIVEKEDSNMKSLMDAFFAAPRDASESTNEA